MSYLSKIRVFKFGHILRMAHMHTPEKKTRCVYKTLMPRTKSQKWPWSSACKRRIIYKFLNLCPFVYTAFAVSGKVGTP